VFTIRAAGRKIGRDQNIIFFFSLTKEKKKKKQKKKRTKWEMICVVRLQFVLPQHGQKKRDIGLFVVSGKTTKIWHRDDV
jgi:hypothetical protein